MAASDYSVKVWLSLNDYLTLISHFSLMRYTSSPTYMSLYTAVLFLESKRSICFTKIFYFDFREESVVEDLITASFILLNQYR